MYLICMGEYHRLNGVSLMLWLDAVVFKVGKKKANVVHKDHGTTEEDVTLTNVKYLPGLWVNLFSIS